MNKEIKTKWIEALQSGEYTKGKYTLRWDNEFCCLGVLADLLKLPKEKKLNGAWLYGNEGKSTITLPAQICENIDLPYSVMLELTTVNDSNDTFEPVIEYIKYNL